MAAGGDVFVPELADRVSDSSGRIRGIRSVLRAAAAGADIPLDDPLLLNAMVRLCDRVLFDLAVTERDIVTGRVAV